MGNNKLDFYNQIIFVDRENSILGFSQPVRVSTDNITPAEEMRSKKKQEALKQLEQRIHQYTYQV